MGNLQMKRKGRHLRQVNMKDINSQFFSHIEAPEYDFFEPKLVEDKQKSPRE